MAPASVERVPSAVPIGVGHGLEVRLGADGLDLGGEVGEEVGNLVEAISVLALDLTKALLAPNAEVVVPAPVAYLAPKMATSAWSASSGFFSPISARRSSRGASCHSSPRRALYSSVTRCPVSASWLLLLSGGGRKK